MLLRQAKHVNAGEFLENCKTQGKTGEKSCVTLTIIIAMVRTETQNMRIHYTSISEANALQSAGADGVV